MGSKKQFEKNNNLEVKINYDDDCEMMEIIKNDETIFFGNYWDFDREPQRLTKFLESLDVNVKLKKKKM